MNSPDTNSTYQTLIKLYDRFTHGGMARRDFMARMVALTGSLAAANAAILAIGGDAVLAQTIPETDVLAETWAWQADGRSLSGYFVRDPAMLTPKAAVLVIHENRGLTPHIKDVARRFAKAGYPALALDFLSPVGGTSADEDAARAAIGALNLTFATRDGLAAIARLKSVLDLPVAVSGFCWGGAMTMRLAVDAGNDIAAAIPFYGTAPDPSLAKDVDAPVLFQLAGLDERVNGTAVPFAQAMLVAGKRVQVHIYNGANHAFHNDTSAARYDAAAARLAWQRTLDFLAEECG